MARDRSLALFGIGLVLGGGVGFVLAAGFGVTLDGHDHESHGSPAAVASLVGGDPSAHHGHGDVLSLPEGPNAPTVAIEVTPDVASGWNLHIRTTNFRFVPESAGRRHVPGEGHAHLYVNDDKYIRLYGPWTHLPTLPPGDVEIEVTLNANDHRLLAVGDRPLAAGATVFVK